MCQYRQCTANNTGSIAGFFAISNLTNAPIEFSSQYQVQTTSIFIPEKTHPELRIYVNPMGKELIFYVLMTFLCCNNKAGEAREKLSITSLSMQSREISPLGSKFNQGLGKPRPWFKFPPLGCNISILHGHS